MTTPPARAYLVAALLGAAAPAGCRPAAAPPAAPPPPAVTVAHPASYPVQSYYEYNGYLDAVEAVDVRARVKGFLNDVHFAEGDELPQGARLYTIDPREYVAGVAKSRADIARAEADEANARAQIKLAEADFDRLTRLAAAASKSELDKAAATLAANKAQLDVAGANKAAAGAALQTNELELGYADIRSPIAGRISRTRVTRGNLVGQNEATLLTTIVGVDPLYVYFDVPERDLVEYQRSLRDKPAGGGVVGVEVGVATEEGYPHAGVLDFRENRVDTGTGTVRLRGRVPNPPVGAGKARLLYPGLFSRVRVPNGGPRPLLVLPEDALQTGQEGRFVYVIGKDNVVQKRTVAVGPAVWRAPPPGAAAPGWQVVNPNPPPAGPAADPAAKPPAAPAVLAVRSVVAIEKGLDAGDLVVVNGLQKARPGAPVAPDAWDLRPPAAAPPAR